jgi:hypothetical protein
MTLRGLRRQAQGDDKRRRSDHFREPQLSESLKLVGLLRQVARLPQHHSPARWPWPGPSATQP